VREGHRESERESQADSALSSIPGRLDATTLRS